MSAQFSIFFQSLFILHSRQRAVWKGRRAVRVSARHVYPSCRWVEGIKDVLRSFVAGYQRPPTVLTEADSYVLSLIHNAMWQGASWNSEMLWNRDAQMLLVSTLHVGCQQQHNTNTSFPPRQIPGLIFHLAARELSTLSGSRQVVSERKRGSDVDDKLLINLQEIKRNLDLIR